MDTNTFFVLTVVMISIVILSGFMLYKLPGLTRPDIYFSVTIKPEFRQSQGAREALAGYQREIIIHSLIGIGLIILAIRLGGIYFLPIRVCLCVCVCACVSVTKLYPFL